MRPQGLNLGRLSSMQELLNFKLPDRKLSLVTIPSTKQGNATSGMLNYQEMIRLQQQYDEGKINHNFYGNLNN